MRVPIQLTVEYQFSRLKFFSTIQTDTIPTDTFPTIPTDTLLTTPPNTLVSDTIPTDTLPTDVYTYCMVIPMSPII